jgi:hypothetical protein
MSDCAPVNIFTFTHLRISNFKGYQVKEAGHAQVEICLG